MSFRPLSLPGAGLRTAFRAKCTVGGAQNPPRGAVAGVRAGTRYSGHVEVISTEILRKALVRVRLRIVGHGVGVAQVLADRLERLHLLLPGLGEVGLPSGALRDAAGTRRWRWRPCWLRWWKSRRSGFPRPPPPRARRPGPPCWRCPGRWKRTMTTLRPGTLAASRRVSSREL